MKNIDLLRSKINTIDNSLRKLLNDRFTISIQIGNLKFRENKAIINNEREKEVLFLSSSFSHHHAIKKVYEKILIESREMQKKYFLVGKRLSYSYSETIHNYFDNLNYAMMEVDQFQDIMNIPFLGINITNPFKHEAFKNCNLTDEISKRTKIVNTIIKHDGIIHGFNTDYEGFLSLLEHFKIKVQNQTIGIIGGGNTEKTIRAVLEDLKSKNIFTFVRNIKNDNEINLTEIFNYPLDILINATSYNVYPFLETVPLINPNLIKGLKIIIDINYNPERSALILKSNKIKYYDGLWMLIAQAQKAEALFKKYTGLNNTPTKEIKPIYDVIKEKQRNIVLIGMPYAGKTTIGQYLAKHLHLPFYDSDLILQSQGFDLNTILKKGLSEMDFRDIENKVISELALHNNSIIACGGGAVINHNNMIKLKQNGIIVFLNPPLNILIERLDQTRPLTKNEKEIKEKYEERISLYQKFADIEIDSIDKDEISKIIKEYITHEIINN